MQDKGSGSPLIYFFYVHMTIRPKYMVLFHLFFLLCTIIQPKIWVFIINSIFYLCTTIRLKIRVLNDLFLLFALDHSTKLHVIFHYSFFSAQPFDQKLGSTSIHVFHLYTTIWPKIRVLINLILLFVHDHLTKN